MLKKILDKSERKIRDGQKIGHDAFWEDIGKSN